MQRIEGLASERTSQSLEKLKREEIETPNDRWEQGALVKDDTLSQSEYEMSPQACGLNAWASDGRAILVD